MLWSSSRDKRGHQQIKWPPHPALSGVNLPSDEINTGLSDWAHAKCKGILCPCVGLTGKLEWVQAITQHRWEMLTDNLLYNANDWCQSYEGGDMKTCCKGQCVEAFLLFHLELRHLDNGVRTCCILPHEWKQSEQIQCQTHSAAGKHDQMHWVWLWGGQYIL